MNARTSPLALLRETVAAARSQPMTSLLTIAMVAGMCAAALLTTGRTVAAEHAALAQIDAAGTRTVTVRADPDAGLTVALLDVLRRVNAVEAVTGFGPVTDARNANVPGAARVATRLAYGTIGDQTLTPLPVGGAVTERRALASPSAATALGLLNGTGALIADDGRGIAVVGALTVPQHLGFLEPLVITPATTTDDPTAPLAVLVVLARTPQQVAAVETTVRGLLDGVNPTTVTVETSAGLAAIRAAVHGELGTYSRGLILVILVVAAALVAVNNLALVTLRRKDFGRRRALGATQTLIITLLLGQVALLALIGGLLGTATALTALAASRTPLPGATFTIAVTIAAVLTAVLAALLPAIVASRRDPLHELRVP